MKILILTPAWPIESTGDHAGEFVRDQALELKAQGMDVQVICPTPWLWRSKYPRHDFIDEDIPVYFPHYPHAPLYPFRQVQGKVESWLINHILKDIGEPDIIHAHFILPTGQAACEVSQIRNIPSILTLHESGAFMKRILDNPTPAHIQALTWNIALIRVALFDIQRFDKYNHRVIHIGNGFNLDKFKYLHEPNGGGPNLLGIGLLSKRKGYQDLIAVMPQILKTYPHAIFRVIGQDNHYENYLKDQIASLNLKDHVQLLGSVTSSKMLELLNEANLLIHPSYDETFGVSQIEAMACGCPVIATPNGGSEEMLEGRGHMGRVIPRNELGSETLLALEQCWDRKRISQEARELWGMDIIAKQLKNLYKELVDMWGGYTD